jgi:hypothetical protein
LNSAERRRLLDRPIKQANDRAIDPRFPFAIGTERGRSQELLLDSLLALARP